jgi:drug/metabolite transporter (DMT)-like permease
VGALLGLLAAIGYGASDFVAGLASRRASAITVTFVVLVVELPPSIITAFFYHGVGITPGVLLWGALSGVGSAGGTLALYHGFVVGRMSVVATLAGVLTVVIPAGVGIAEGNHVSVLIIAGILAAIVAVALVSWSGGKSTGRSGALYGVIAGVLFALLFITLDHAGTASGVWPVLIGQVVACLGMLVPGVRALRAHGAPAGRAMWQSVWAGLIAGAAAMTYLIATGFGELAVVAVLTAMYPAITVLLARIVLKEHWSRLQALGLALSVLSVLAVALG